MAEQSIYLSTLGVHMYYGVEKIAGIMPTTKADFTELEGVKSVPSMNPSPDSLDTTTLNETEYKTSIPGLKDLGGALGFRFNMSQKLVDVWDELVEAYTTAAAAGKRTWFYIEIPGLTKGLFFPGQPTSIGLPELGVNSVIEVENSIIPIGAPVWATKPTA